MKECLVLEILNSAIHNYKYYTFIFSLIVPSVNHNLFTDKAYSVHKISDITVW
jgi:hypothetical protein